MAAIQRLIKLVDEFPGRKDKTLTEEEFVVNLERRTSPTPTFAPPRATPSPTPWSLWQPS